jgi:aryl-alcohol dehydrogenase
MVRPAVEALRPHGVVALFNGESGTDSLPEGKKAIRIIEGDSVPQRFIPRLIELYLEGRFPFDRLVKLYDFAAINRAMNDSRKGRTVKPVLRIGDL